jgi:glycosyltransferase involved in cell wall biosynthesis
MTIAIDIIGTNLGSGTKTYNINLCNELNSLNLNSNSNIIIFICRSYLSQIKKIKNKKIKYIIKPNYLSISIFRLFWMQFILPFELKLLGVKKIYSPMNFVPIISKLLNIKIILCLHTNLPWIYFDFLPGSRIKNFIVKKFMEISIYACDLLIVNSNFAKKEIIKALQLQKKNIKVVHLGINKIFFLQKKNKKIKNFNYNQKYILSVLSCVKYHNIINVLKAFSLLSENNNLKFVLVLQVLDKNYFFEIKRFIKNNYLENKVDILNDVSLYELPELYKKAKVYVFTSYCEVFGYTSLEAMTQQTPVAISNRSALPEINKNAVKFFDPDDIQSIFNSIESILSSKNLRKRLINKGNNLLKEYDSYKSVRNTINLIENLN